MNVKSVSDKGINYMNMKSVSDKGINYICFWLN
jgi:hypothetical protein